MRRSLITMASAVGLAAKILPVKVLEAGSGSSEDIAAGIRWATDHGANVINMSLGSVPGGQAVSISGLDTAMKDAIAYARSKGVLTVAAAGNSSTALCNDPAFDSEAICTARRTGMGFTAGTPSCPTRSTRGRSRLPVARPLRAVMTTSGRRSRSARAPPPVARRTTTRMPGRPWRHHMSPGWPRCCLPRAALSMVSSTQS